MNNESLIAAGTVVPSEIKLLQAVLDHFKAGLVNKETYIQNTLAVFNNMFSQEKSDIIDEIEKDLSEKGYYFKDISDLVHDWNKNYHMFYTSRNIKNEKRQ